MEVPTISLARTQPDQFSQAFGQALENTGFAIITDHGIERTLLDAAYGVAAQVFAYSDDILTKYTYPGGGGRVGFTRFGTEHAKDHPVPDRKRFWHIHRPVEWPNIWPAEVPEFESVTSELFAQLDGLSFRLLDSLDRYLGHLPGALRGMVAGGDSLLRVLHYPPIDDRLPDAPGSWTGAIRSAAHEDINLITLLVAATASGLQVQDRQFRWFPVNEEPGSIVVNAADMLQMLTEGRLRSTTHRVVNPPSGDTGDRYSMPFFVHPRPDVVLDQATGFTAEQYLHQRLREIGLYGGAPATKE